MQRLKNSWKSRFRNSRKFTRPTAIITQTHTFFMQVKKACITICFKTKTFLVFRFGRYSRNTGLNVSGSIANQVKRCVPKTWSICSETSHFQFKLNDRSKAHTSLTLSLSLCNSHSLIFLQQTGCLWQIKKEKKRKKENGGHRLQTDTGERTLEA